MSTAHDSSSSRLMRWLKFNCVGAIGIGVQLSALALLKSGLALNYLLATALAVEAAVLHNFLWHERFTWADRRTSSSLTRFLKFSLSTGALSIAGNLFSMKLLVGMAGLDYLLANLLSIAACSVLNFLIADRTIFVAVGGGNACITACFQSVEKRGIDGVSGRHSQ